MLVLRMRMNMRMRVRDRPMRVPVRMHLVRAQQQLMIAEDLGRAAARRHPALFQHEDAI